MGGKLRHASAARRARSGRAITGGDDAGQFNSVPQDAIGRLFVGGLYDKLKDLSTRTPEIRRGDDAALRKKLGVPDDDRRR